MLDDGQFRLVADEALQDLFDALVDVADKHGFECDYEGAVKVEFEDPPAKFVVSPNAPVKQIWVSAHSKSYKLDWNEERKVFVLGETGETLNDLLGKAVSEQLGERVAL
jgi:iron donor protein CyaY